jgi:hypothetical protein
MAIKLSSLPPDLRRLVLAQAGMKPSVRRPKAAPVRHHLPRVCSCGFEMYRPDGHYPEACDGCGLDWPRPD